jgi:enoyl-CoA hydratase
MYKYFLMEKTEGVGIVTINRPPVNAMSYGLIAELKKLADDIESDKDIRCAVFRSGIEKYFSTGADMTDIPPEILSKIAVKPGMTDLREIVKDILPDLTEHIAVIFEQVHEVFNMIESLSVPTIASINGHALGGGMELALLCDFRYMGAGSGKIGLPEINMGLIPLGGGTQRLTRLIGKSRAMELLFTGRKLNSDEALSAGLVNGVFDWTELDREVLNRAKNLALGSSSAQRLIKSCVNTGINRSFHEGLGEERAALTELLKSDDVIEGVLAFLEKRDPRYNG